MIYRFIYNIVIVNNRNTNNNTCNSLVVIIVFISCSVFLFYLSDRTISSTVEYFSACLLCTPLINPFLLKKMRMIIRNRKWLCVKTKMCIDFRLIIDIATGYWLIWNFIAYMLPVRLLYLTCFRNSSLNDFVCLVKCGNSAKKISFFTGHLGLYHKYLMVCLESLQSHSLLTKNYGNN